VNHNTKLSDILQGNMESLKSAWQNTEAAGDFSTEPIPAGTYEARLMDGELFQSRHGTPGYKLTFEIAEGDPDAGSEKYANRRCWHDLWLTPAAMPMTKRDLAKLGVSDFAQLERPLPAVLRVKLRLAVRRDDDGNTYNRVQRFDVVGIDEPEKDAFDTDAGACPEPAEGAEQ
jgi:hypothetical protein